MLPCKNALEWGRGDAVCRSGLCLKMERGVHIIDVFLVKTLAQQFNCFSKTLEMDDLAFPQEADGIVHIRVVGNAEDIVIRHARLLLCCNCENATFCIYICGKFQKFQ